MMRAVNRKLPLGIDSFTKIQQEKFYYVDKTAFIRELLTTWGEVNLFTRPRRFGKTLNMDMLKTFFEIGTDHSLFEGLAISKEKELCEKYMGRFPVISISLKSVDGSTFEDALAKMSITIRREARRFQFLMDSDRLSEIDREALKPLYAQEISREIQQESLTILSEMLYKHYGQKVIILLDEYDVPLEKAYQNGYYDEIVNHIRSMFEMALKTNDFLFFAVLTGCLRISKESIFTGLNNFKVYSISDARYDEYFGFTDCEIKQLLADYDMEEKYSEVKDWYNGYRFGQASVYCPWDVLNYVSDHLADPDGEPQLYWANSSGNAIIRDMIEQASGTVRAEIETLVSGENVVKEIVPEMTYHDLDAEDDDDKMGYLWSLLYNTGYLTETETGDGRWKSLAIPNREVKMIFEQQILRWFSRFIKSDSGKLENFCLAVKEGNAEEMQQSLNDFLRKSISVRDSAVRKGRKESFYHGLIVGILGSEDEWIVRSNPETGNGYSDILVEIPEEKTGCVIEVKYAENAAFDKACEEAMEQIVDKNYMEKLRLDGIDIIHAYGIACWMKECRIAHCCFSN